MSVEHYSALSVSDDQPLHLSASADLPADTVVTGETQALSVMHDFHRMSPSVLRESMSLSQATMLFDVARVRYFLVENDAGVFKGVLSVKDTMMSARLVAMMQQKNLRMADLQVRDVMTPRKSIHTVSFASLRHARVGDVLQTMDRLGESYLCVTEADDASNLRGFFCASEIAGRIGQGRGIARAARTFSELKLTLLEGRELEN